MSQFIVFVHIMLGTLCLEINKSMYLLQVEPP